MHPIERLRYVARAYEVDANLLAQEAADALGSLGDDPMTLVTSVRRLIEAHPDCGPLVWVSAQLLGAEDPVGHAHDIVTELALDPTSDELAAALPGGATVVVSPSTVIIAACEERPDLTVVLCGARPSQRSLIRSLNTLANVAEFELADLSDALDDVDLVVVEARMISTAGVVLSEHDAALIDAAIAADVPCWVVGGVGHVLPAPIFDGCLDRLAIAESKTEEDTDDVLPDHNSQDSKSHRNCALRPVAVAQAIVGPKGPFVPNVHTLHTTCPTPGELCRRR